MIELTLQGPLADPDLLACVLGPAAAGVEPAGGAGVVRVAGEALARIDYFLEIAGYRRVAGGGPPPVFAVEAAAGGARRELGPAGRKALRLELADEIMSLYPGRPAAEVARLVPAMVPRALARVRGRAAEVAAGLRLPRAGGDVVALALTRPYAAYFAIEEHRLAHRRFDGAMSPPLERAVIASGDAVTVLPYDARRDRVLLIEQFRPGPTARRDPHPWCLEAIAGRCDADESLEATARREAIEEAGLTLGRLERIAGYYSSPGIASEHITAFVGEAELAGVGGVFGCDREHEDIRSLAIPRAAARAALEAGEANNAQLMISLLWLELHAERLRREWVGGVALDGGAGSR